MTRSGALTPGSDGDLPPSASGLSDPVAAAAIAEAIDEPVASPMRAGFDAWWTLGVVSTLYVVSYLNRFVITLVVPEVKASLGMSDVQMGMILGPAFALSFALFGIPFGWAADRYSRRMVILIGAVLFSIATAASGLATSFATLLLYRIGLGLGEASLSPAALSLVAQKFPRDRLTTAVSIFSSGPKWGTAVSLALGGVIVAASIWLTRHVGALAAIEPWRLSFAITAVPAFLIGLLTLTFREPALPVRRSGSAAPDSAVRFMIDQRALMVPMLIGIGATIVCGQAVISWVPAYLQRIFHWPALGYGPVLGLISTIGALSLVLKGLLMDRLFARGVRDIHLRFYTWLLLATFPVAIACFLVHSRWAFVLCYFVIGVVTIPSITYASVVVQMVAPPALRGRVFATISIPLSVVGSVGPPLVGALTDYVFHDEAKVGWSLAVTLGVAIPIAFVALRASLPGLRQAIDASRTYS